MHRPQITIGSSFLPRVKALIWGLWALSRWWGYAPPNTSFIAHIESLTPLPLAWFWLIAGVFLIVGSFPADGGFARFRCATRRLRMVGINGVATLTSIWLTASIIDWNFKAATSNMLFVALALISAYTIARDRTVRGDAPNVI